MLAMVDFHPFLDYLKKPFEMGFWKWRVHPVEEAKTKNNRASVTPTKSKRSSVLTNRQSITLNSPKVPSWEVIVDQHLQQCLRAAKLRDFTYFRLSAALSAKPDTEQIDYKATLLAKIYEDEPVHELETLNKEKCEEVGRAFKEYVRGIQKAEKKQPDNWLAWGRLLDAEEERVIEMLVAKIKETSEKATAVIRDLPLEARDIAAGVWVQGSGVTMSCFRTMCAQITIVSGRVGDFERGEFGVLSQAEEKVKDAVDAGILSVFDRPGDVRDSRRND